MLPKLSKPTTDNNWIYINTHKWWVKLQYFIELKIVISFSKKVYFVKINAFESLFVQLRLVDVGRRTIFIHNLALKPFWVRDPCFKTTHVSSLDLYVTHLWHFSQHSSVLQSPPYIATPPLHCTLSQQSQWKIFLLFCNYANRSLTDIIDSYLT